MRCEGRLSGGILEAFVGLYQTMSRIGILLPLEMALAFGMAAT
jgi:hypothetical protein